MSQIVKHQVLNWASPAIFLLFGVTWIVGGVLWLLSDHLAVAISYWAIAVFWAISAFWTWRTGQTRYTINDSRTST